MKNYGVRFGSGDPRTFSGLTPTFLLFLDMAAGTTRTPPAITEVIPSSGLYTFQYGTTTPIAFLIDANSAAPGTTGRYVTGQLDPADRADEYGNSLMAFGASIYASGVTNVALGNTNLYIGNLNYGLGQTSVATSTLYGIQNNNTITAFGNTTVYYGSINYTRGGTILGVLLEQGSFSISSIGSITSNIGDANTPPSTLFGYLMRVRENLEGNSTYNKVNGAFTILTRGSSTILANKTITNSVTTVIKT